MLIQVLLVLFFLLAIAKVVGRRRAGELSARAMIAWVFFWVLAILVVLRPDSTSSAAKLLGVGRGADVVVYLSLAGLFFVVFRLMVKIEKLNREITQVVRDKTLNIKK